MANTIDFNINSNGAEVLNKTAVAADGAAKGFTSAKAELRALNQQLLQMDSSSEEFKKASARAAELKDNISDLSAEINANAGNAFEGLSNNVGLFGSRLMDLDLKGAGQALSGMGAAVGKIDFKTLKDEVGGLVTGLANLGKALLANPLFLAGAALAATVVYWKEIKEAVDGTAEKVEKLGEANVVLDKQNQILDARINKEKTLYGESSKTLELEKEKAQNNIQVAQNELDIARTTGDINTIRDKENKLIEMRNLLSGITNKGEADRMKLIEEAKNITIAGYKEEQERNRAVAKFEDARAQQLAVISQKQTEIKASLDAQSVTDIKILTNARQNFSQRDKQTQFEILQENRKKQLQKELNDLIYEEQVLRNAKLAIITETTVADLKAKDAQKEATERTKTQFAEVKSLGLQRIEFNEVVVDAIVSQEDKLAKVQKENAVKLAEHEKQVALDTANARLEIAQQGLTALTALGDAYFSSQLANVQAGSKAELDLKKKQFAFNKKMQIGGAIMDTAKAITAAIAANPFPSPTLPVSIALASITGAAQIAKIASTKFDGGGGGGGGGVNIPTGGDGTTAPSPANYDFISQQPNQQPPLQAYVVGTQVSSNLEAQQLIQNQSRLGG